MPAAIENHKKLFQACDLPPLSQVGLEISRLSERDDISASQLARLISKDAALAAKVLRIANSPFYGLRTQVKTLDHAILVLGQVHITSICSAFTLLGVLKIPTSPGHDRYSIHTLRSHFILTALVAKWLAQQIASPHMPVADAFLGGLFHDIGELATVVYYAKHLEDLRQYEQAHPAMPNYQAEQAILGFDHQEFGAAVLHHWHLPQLYIDIAQYHHTGTSAVDSGEGMMVSLLQAADQAAIIMKNGFPPLAAPGQTQQQNWQEHWKSLLAPIPNVPSGITEQLEIQKVHLLEEAKVMIEQGEY